MRPYSRDYPDFALCGLNCVLCPRYHTAGSSRCPGCGGPDFSEKHPTCAVVTCSRKHGDVQFCFECGDYPCKKYQEQGAVDSFISYRNVASDLAAAKKNLAAYKKTLAAKAAALGELLANFDDGRSKGLYCLAANLLSPKALEAVLKELRKLPAGESPKERAKAASAFLGAKAAEAGVELALRK